MKTNNLFSPIILLLILLACASQKKMVQEGDALVLLTDLTKASQAKNFELNQQKVSEIVAKMDSLCEDEIIVSQVNDVEKLEKQVNKTSQLDDLLLDHAKKTDNNRLEISVRELKFRTLVQTQRRMDEFFENEGIHETVKAETDTLDIDKKEEFKKGEVHGKWVFKERVSMMLPYMQANEKFSHEKTRHLLAIIDLLSEIKHKEAKKRCWLAIDRMLDEVDVQKSESGYQPFQRGPYGLYIQSGEIIDKLKVQHSRETDEEISAFSEQVISKLEKNLSAKKSGEFWQKVEFSRELNKKIQVEGFKVHDSDERSKPMKEGLTASEWFDKGYVETDDNIKIEYYTRAIELDSQYAAAYNNRGHTYQALGQNQPALDDFNRAIELNPGFEPAYINRGNIYQKLDRPEDAVQDFSKAIELETKYTFAYYNRGMSYKNLGRYEEALLDFNKAVQLEPKFVSAYFNRGDIYRKLGKDNEAVLDYTRVIEIDPNHALAYNNRGLCYNTLGSHQKAILDYSKAIEVAPDYAAAYYNLGIVYWTLNRWQDVVNAWDKSLELNPDQSYIIEYLPKARRQARKMR